jgi:succinoglycan biosynthesis protein ExoA
MGKYPTLSVVIPTYNESDNIERLLCSLLATKYPNLIEICVVDGGSDDLTIQIVESISLKDLRVKLLHNVRKIQSSALNNALYQSNCNVILRADAHSEYADDYIENCIEALLKSGSFNVGGAQRFVAKSAFQAGVALASKSLLGSGGAKYRDPNYDGYAETVYLGCFWRDKLLQIGGWDESLVVNEDSELNVRLNNLYQQTQKESDELSLVEEAKNINKSAVYISSKIKAQYYPRDTWKSLLTQYFKYGRGCYITASKHNITVLPRSKIPFVVISLLIFICIIDLIFPHLNVLGLESIPLLLILPFLEGLRTTWQHRQSFDDEIWKGTKENRPALFILAMYSGLAILTMPFAHFSGYAYQLFSTKVLMKPSW